MRMMLAYTIQRFGNLLELILCARAILSWFAQDPYSTPGKIYQFLVRFTEPLVAPCRKLLSRFNTGMFDFSVLLCLLFIQIITSVLVRILI